MTLWIFVMDDQSYIDDNSSDFLPDLTEGKTLEQIAFEENILKVNERFVSIRNDIIRWILSPPENHFYPKSAKMNKYTFKQNAMKYSYDNSTKKLLLHRVCHDKIGKLAENYFLCCERSKCARNRSCTQFRKAEFPHIRLKHHI